MSLEIHQFPCLSDNYGFLIHDSQARLTAAVDTPEAGPILSALDNKGWHLTHILNTHHHWDHTGGNIELKEKTGCTIAGPAAEAEKIPGIDILLKEGDLFSFGTHKARIHETPGHTLGHIVYHFAGDGIAFVGDTLFAMGCGRLFEGTADQMWKSLQKILQWPDDTLIYCAHEYTENNARFALTIDPDNPLLQERYKLVKQARFVNKPTIPVLLREEKSTNPFLRAGDKALKQYLEIPEANDENVFAKIRQLKDSF